MPESDEMLSASVRHELRREVNFGAVSRARVMSAVRREAARPARRGWLSPVAAFALAASATLMIAGGTVQRQDAARMAAPAHLDTLATLHSIVPDVHRFPVLADMTYRSAPRAPLPGSVTSPQRVFPDSL